MPEHQQIQQSKKPDTSFQKPATPVIKTPLSNPYSIIQRAKINPKSLTHADVMQLQRTIGNQAVGRLLSSIGNTSTAQQATVQRQEIPEQEEPLQGKFENKPEQMACPSCFTDPIVQRQEIPEEEEPFQGKMMRTIQRQEISGEEEPLQGKFESIQRQEIPEEEEPLQGKMADPLQLQEIPEEEEPLQTKRENNTGMPDNLKAGVEDLSGLDMSDVRVHYNSLKPAEVGALAYTQGTNIHVAPGQERHLPHEAWHVVQQAQGRVRPTMQLKDGVPVNDDQGLEHEADVMGAKALQKYAQVEKKKENKSRAVANSVAQKKSSVQQDFRFVDNRAEAAEQRKLQKSMTTNFQTSNVTGFHADLSNSDPLQQLIQKKENEIGCEPFSCFTAQQLEATIQHNNRKQVEKVLKKTAMPIQHKTVSVTQMERPKPLDEMVADRMGRDSEHGRETDHDVRAASNADDVLLDVYRIARDNNLHITTDGILKEFHRDVPQAIALVQFCVQTAKKQVQDDENGQAKVFEEQFNQITKQNDNISAVMKYFYEKTSNKAAADRYLATYLQANQNFDFGIRGPWKPYEAPQAGFFGPSQSSYDVGTRIANRVLRDASQEPTEEQAFTYLAVAIKNARSSSLDSLLIVSEILEQYLKPKIMKFIYSLPLAEQMESDDGWGGDTLEKGIQYADGRLLRENDTWVRPHVRTAWIQIKDIVHPAVLKHAGRASVQVDGAFSRAFYSNNLIHVGWLVCGQKTIMHEFGHHLEDNAKVSRWVKLQQLLRNRSGDELTRIFPFTIPYVISRNEMRYDANLPASGEMGGCFGYNVKYYPYGSTEVVSTSFEVFHNREKAYQIAIKDPGMFLAVMGVLRDR